MIENNSDILVLPATLRTELGTGPARALRRTNMVPAIVYASGKKNLAIAVETKEIMKLYRNGKFTSTVLELEIEGKKHKVLPKTIELHPVTDIVRHVDFVFLGKDVQKLHVPIVFEGRERSVGIKRGGYFNIVKRTVPIECNPKSVPASIVVDVSTMQISQSLKAQDLKLANGSKLLCLPNTIIASIIGNKGAKAEDEVKAS